MPDELLVVDQTEQHGAGLGRSQLFCRVRRSTAREEHQRGDGQAGYREPGAWHVVVTEGDHTQAFARVVVAEGREERALGWTGSPKSPTVDEGSELRAQVLDDPSIALRAKPQMLWGDQRILDRDVAV